MFPCCLHFCVVQRKFNRLNRFPRNDLYLEGLRICRPCLSVPEPLSINTNNKHAISLLGYGVIGNYASSKLSACRTFREHSDVPSK
jgi:hypothetical protein